MRRYHTIPNATGGGSLGTNYYRTFYRYDANTGKKTHEIRVVSGTLTSNSVETVTKYEYDQRGRMTTVWQGVSPATGDMGASYDQNEPTYKKINVRFYDESTPGTHNTAGVGDGRITSECTYYDTHNANDADENTIKTVYHYDYRGRLRGTVRAAYEGGQSTEKAPWTVYDVNFLGQRTAVGQFSAAPTWGTVLGDVDYAETTATNRLALSTTAYDEKGQVYQSANHDIDPADGSDDGSLTTDYWYDARGNRIKEDGPTDLLRKMVYDGAGRLVTTYLCYDNDGDDSEGGSAYDGAQNVSGDTVVTAMFSEYYGERAIGVWEGTELGSNPQPDDPNNGTGGNMVKVSKTWYDADHDGDTGESDWRPYVTGASTLKASDSTTAFVLTRYEYDEAGRQCVTILPDPDDTGDLVETKMEQTFDDLARVKFTKTYKKDGETLTLLAQTENTYDDRIAVAYTKAYKVSGGTATDYLETEFDYDGYGNLCKVTKASGAFTKTLYDAWGRVTGTYLCTAEGATDDATSVAADTVVEQTIPAYDSLGRVWLSRSFRRNDNATGGGALKHSSEGEPKARVMHRVMWFDDLGRSEKVVNYGTNGGTAIDEQTDVNYTGGGPSTNTSSDYMVMVPEYDGYGRQHKVTDNAGKITRTFYDSSGRMQYVVENYDDFDPTNENTAGSNPNDRVTKYVYNKADQVTQRVAMDAGCDKNPSDNQVTKYVYAAELTDKGCPVKSNARLRAVIYPDSDDTVSAQALADGTDEAYDRVELVYFSEGSIKTRKDQRGVVHVYAYDDLGRLVSDDADDAGYALPAGVDDYVVKIGRSYDDLGRVGRITSYADDDDVRNEVEFAFDGWEGVATSWQEHAGEAVTSDENESPKVQYAYEDGVENNKAKYVRIDKVTYPGASREVYYNYPSSGIGAALSRLQNTAANGSPNDSQKYAEYDYFGAGTVYQVTYPAVQVSGNALGLTYGGSGSYTGLDRLDRVVDHNWRIKTAGTVKDRYKYGYDKGSNRIWRESSLTHGTADKFDEYYTYDGLHRLTNMDRGTLTGSPYTGISGTPEREQDFTLDLLGNWGGYVEKTQGTTGLDQARYHNNANEIDTDNNHANAPGEALSATTGANWVDPAYDAAGNMTSGPKPGAESESGGTELEFTYDAWNRLVKVEDAGGTVAEYRHDGLHRRIAKLIPGSDWDRTDYYYSIAWQVLEERFDDGISTQNKDNPVTVVKAQYVWDLRYIDAPVLRWRDNDANPDLEETLYYTNDANMNVTALVDTSGTIQERYVYDSYGEVTCLDANWSNGQSASRKNNEVLYCGYRRDPETGLYHVRYRPYHSTLGQWLSRDPNGYRDGNGLYEYVSSMPVIGMDPFGLWREKSSGGEEVIWTSTSDLDGERTLVSLVEKVSAQYGIRNSDANWVCIRPRPPEDKPWLEKAMKDEYEEKRGAQCGEYDVGNLIDRWTTGGNSLMFRLSDDQFSTLMSRFIRRHTGRNVPPATGRRRSFKELIQRKAQYGSRPISLLWIIGHGNARSKDMFSQTSGPDTQGLGMSYGIEDLLPMAWKNTWENVTSSRLDSPKGRYAAICYFTHKAEARFIGCNTVRVARDWAQRVLRQGATAYGTLRFVMTPPHGEYVRFQESGSDNRSRYVNGIYTTWDDFINSRNSIQKARGFKPGREGIDYAEDITGPFWNPIPGVN